MVDRIHGWGASRCIFFPFPRCNPRLRSFPSAPLPNPSRPVTSSRPCPPPQAGTRQADVQRRTAAAAGQAPQRAARAGRVRGQRVALHPAGGLKGVRGPEGGTQGQAEFSGDTDPPPPGMYEKPWGGGLDHPYQQPTYPPTDAPEQRRAFA